MAALLWEWVVVGIEQSRKCPVAKRIQFVCHKGLFFGEGVAQLHCFDLFDQLLTDL